MLDPGKLRHRIVIEAKTVTQDTFGDLTETWATFATVWAAIEPLSVRDFIASSQVQAGVSARITIRALSGLLPSMRISYRSKVYNIAGILPDKDSGLEYVTLAVSEGVNNG